MTACAECGEEFPVLSTCDVCGGRYCRSERDPSRHNCVSAEKPTVRSLSSDDWSPLSHVVNKLLFVVLSLSLVLWLLELLG